MGNQESYYEDPSFLDRRRRRRLSTGGNESGRSSRFTTDATTTNATTTASQQESSSTSFTSQFTTMSSSSSQYWPSSTTMDEIFHGLSFQPKTIGVTNDRDMRQRSYDRAQEFERKQQSRSQRLAQIEQARDDHRTVVSRYGYGRSSSNIRNGEIIVNEEEDSDRSNSTFCGLCCW